MSVEGSGVDRLSSVGSWSTALTSYVVLLMFAVLGCVLVNGLYDVCCFGDSLCLGVSPSCKKLLGVLKTDVLIISYNTSVVMR